MTSTRLFSRPPFPQEQRTRYVGRFDIIEGAATRHRPLENVVDNRAKQVAALPKGGAVEIEAVALVANSIKDEVIEQK